MEASGAAGGSSLAAKVATVDGKVDTLISQVSTMQDSIQQLLLGRGAGVLHARADTEAATQLHPGSKLHPLAHAVGSSQKTTPEKTLFDEKGEVDGSGRDGGGGRGGINEGVNGHEPLMEPLMEPSHLFDQDGGMIRPGEKTSFSTESLTRTASRSPPTLDPVRITVPLETAPRPSVSANGNHALETQGRGSHRRGRSRESRHKVSSRVPLYTRSTLSHKPLSPGGEGGVYPGVGGVWCWWLAMLECISLRRLPLCLPADPVDESCDTVGPLTIACTGVATCAESPTQRWLQPVHPR